MAAAAAPPPGRLVYHLTRRTWEVRWFGAQPPTTWTAPPAISRQTLQAVSIRGGRSSHEEKTAWSNSTRLLLRTEPWSISRTTEFAEVEQLVVVLSVSITHCPMRNPCDGAPVDIGLCHSRICKQLRSRSCLTRLMLLPTATTEICGVSLGRFRTKRSGRMVLVCWGQSEGDVRKPERAWRLERAAPGSLPENGVDWEWARQGRERLQGLL